MSDNSREPVDSCASRLWLTRPRYGSVAMDTRRYLENRKRRGDGKPETFDFLEFTHICSTDRRGYNMPRNGAGPTASVPGTSSGGGAGQLHGGLHLELVLCVEREAKRKRTSKSEIVRRALRRFLGLED